MISHTPETPCPGLSPGNPETLTVWSFYHAEENPKDSCEEETWASQSGLGFQLEPFYLFSLRSFRSFLISLVILIYILLNILWDLMHFIFI
jgi:hypothetical protein